MDWPLVFEGLAGARDCLREGLRVGASIPAGIDDILRDVGGGGLRDSPSGLIDDCLRSGEVEGSID